MAAETPPFPAAPVGFRRSGSRKCAFSGLNRRRFSSRRAGPANSGHASPLSRQVRPGNHQVREARKQRKPRHVLVQAPIANHVAAEPPLDDPERMLHPRPHPGLRSLRPGRGAARASVRRWPGGMAIRHDTSRCACSARLPIPRHPESPRTCSSSPCRSLPEGVRSRRSRPFPPGGAPDPGGRCRCAASSRNATGSPSWSGASPGRGRCSRSWSTMAPR